MRKKAKLALKLEDLQVQSFVTELDAEKLQNIHGGYVTCESGSGNSAPIACRTFACPPRCTNWLSGC